MRRAGFEEFRADKLVAEDEADRALQCTATNCPNVWTVDAGNGRLCSAHAWNHRHRWPQVTEEQLAAVVDRARRSAEPAPAARPLTTGAKTAILRRLGGLRFAKKGRAWAENLRTREEGGAALTRTQRDMWRAALGTSRERPEALAQAAHELDAIPAVPFPEPRPPHEEEMPLFEPDHDAAWTFDEVPL